MGSINLNFIWKEITTDTTLPKAATSPSIVKMKRESKVALEAVARSRVLLNPLTVGIVQHHNKRHIHNQQKSSVIGTIHKLGISTSLGKIWNMLKNSTMTRQKPMI